MRLTIDSFARRLFSRAASEILVESDHLVVATRGGARHLAREEVRRVAASPGWPWDTLRVEPAAGPALVLRGLPRGSAARAALFWQAWGLAPLAASTARAFRALLERDAYCNHTAFEDWRTRAARWGTDIPATLEELPLPDDVKRDFADCRDYIAQGQQRVDARNDAWVRRKKDEHAAWFARAGGSHGLTDEQQEAILRDEDNCLVVAGAGTGKTSTVAGKVAWLLRTGAAQPEHILLLSFTRKAANEMHERIASTVGGEVARQVRVATFHQLGVDILAATDGVRPSVSRYAEDPKALGVAITRHLEAMLADPASRGELGAFLAYGQFPYRSRFEFATAHEYYQYVRGQELRTLKGVKVKSHEELTIANWLHLHGVAYEYERAYAHHTATVEHRQYKPDFYLPDHDLYLEHFGVNRAGETAPWVPREKYLADMAWKRDVHQRFGTRLVETFSWEAMEGVLPAALEAKLLAAGVTLRERPVGEVFAAAAAQQMVAPLAKLLATFLNLHKGNLWSLEELEQRAQEPTRGSRFAGDTGRALAFLRVFRHVLARHEAELRDAGEIDFNDMIARATERVATRRFTSPWTHVIVDEVQDLSRGRGRLLSALLARVHDRRLFCVGDDWQSIYRFTGSDIEQMAAFGQQFGFMRRCDLTRTHRFNTELLDASSTFVQANPAQLRKSLIAARRLGAPAIEVFARQPDEPADACLDRALGRIAEHAAREWQPSVGGATRPTVLLLGRYNGTKPGDWPGLVRRHGRLALDFLTVHRSKGLEADYTVILDVVAGRRGFPSEVVDDPVLDLVLAGTGGYPNAEERRLFYVALTRARHRCVVLTDAAQRSTFVAELEGDSYRAWVVPSDAGAVASPHCPACRGGRLLRRAGAYGPFWGCANFPLCEGKARVCPACHGGALLREGTGVSCSSSSCAYTRSTQAGRPDGGRRGAAR